MEKISIFSQIKEVKLFEHFELMATFGYGYNQQECVDITTDFAISSGKKDRIRWPKMNTFSPRALSFARAKMTRDVVKQYFQNLEKTRLRRQTTLDI
ncbi:hypothetical protein KUTeg_002464 [Tegillarca granosa]|uniref:Uncharacterized protein n=1 Tax=Tegillarca granosa TaxID=220873 RepID=A0ABQ9FXZ3_TEGGR|nr:hypothetical protein KUTeg_002464 [Tegillarca granosa]